MEDKDKRNATKHYQNSDYPSGSFEAAISADQHDRLREGHGLRLERHPLGPGHSGADLEEMVPAFMHRDFFRSEEDAVESVGTSRLRTARREAGKEMSREVPSEPPTPRPAYIPPPDTESYQEPPLTEKVETSAAPRAARTEEPLPPLRSGDSAPAPEPRVVNKPPRTEALRSPTSPPPVPEPVAAPPQAPQVVQQQPNYSVPMLIALAMVLGVFVWREQSRPPLPAAEALPVPMTVASPAAPTPMPEPTVAGVGFRPTYMAVGPSVPQGMEPEASGSPTPVGEEGSLFPAEGQESVSEEEADDRAAILNRMSEAPPPQSAPPSGDEGGDGGDGGDLFPVQEGDSTPASAAPVREAATAPRVASAPRPAPKPAARPAAARPSAAKATATKSAAKPVANKPKAVPVAATAADLFPIDDEVPIRSSKPAAKPAPKPAAAAPISQPVVVPVAAPAASAPVDGYQIDEPNL